MKRIALRLFEQIKARFPEVEFIKFSKNPESENSIFVDITAPEDEDRDIELREYSAELSTDALLEYGFMILFMPTPKAYIEDESHQKVT